MNISTNVEKEFNKIQHAFLMKPLSKPEIEGNFLNLINSIYEKIQLTAHSVVETECFPLNIRNKRRISALITTLHWRSSAKAIKQEIKGIQIGKEEYRNPVESMGLKKHLERISKFSKVGEH